MKKIIMVLVLQLALCCCQVSLKPHPWQSYGDAFSFQEDNNKVDTSDWKTVEHCRLGRVSVENIDVACEMLKEFGAIHITFEKARKMCPKAEFGCADTLEPFLIRGVSYSPENSFYSIVKLNDEASYIYFLQATYSGEFYLPGERFKPQSAPIVVLLEKRPEKVISAAIVGGDGILRGIDFKETWNEQTH